MALVAAILCLGALSVVAYSISRRRASVRLGPLSRRQIAVRVGVLTAVLALGWLLFPIVWVAFFGYGCCNP